MAAWPSITQLISKMITGWAGLADMFRSHRTLGCKGYFPLALPELCDSSTLERLKMSCG